MTAIFMWHAYHQRVEPVEINAGAWYLRAPRQDELMDDRPALAALGETDPDYVAGCTARWESETGFTWAVCEPTTGEMLAEVSVDPATATMRTRTRDGHADATEAAAQSVRRFAAAVLGLTVT
jgi:hypothetical protein